MTVYAKQIAEYLEEQATLGEPITYARVIKRFPELPPLTGIWSNHPLCTIFGELDREDFAQDRAFRTALVVAKKSGMPGQGFFDTLSDLRKEKISKDDQLQVWLAELDALKSDYASK